MEKLVKCELLKKMISRVIIALFIIFASIESVQAQNIQHTQNTFEKPASDLSKDKLDEKDLEAFQNRAIQKVDELFQYLEVMADHANKDAVRDRAFQIAEKQFNESAQFYTGSKGQAIHEYLKKCRNSTAYKSLESITVSKPFAIKSEGHFEGKIQARYKDQDSKTNVKGSKIKEEEITVFLIKKEKTFGSEKRFVWELSLQKIEL